MEKKFTSDEVPLAQLLDQAATGVLQLPDFQRGWVWDDDHIVGLLASISLSYPIGAVMTLRAGNPDVRFHPKPLEGAEPPHPREPEVLLLDGQQRLTSLFLALRSPKAVPTRDAKGKQLLRHYYASIPACIDPLAEREEEGIVSVPENRIVTGAFGRQVILDLSSPEAERAAEMVPLDIILDSGRLTDWQLGYLQHGPGDSAQLLENWKRFDERVIRPFQQYQVPTIELVRSTPKEAVCAVFEKVNTGGVSLSVFELLTATYAADDFRLRADWKQRQEQFSHHRVLGRFGADDFLQVVTLLSTFEKRRQHQATNPADDKAPPVSCKRREVLRLELAEYRKWADVATAAVEKLVPFLHGEFLFRDRDLAYSTQLVPLAAILAALGGAANVHPNLQKLRQWYWCGVLGEMYGGATETRFANDIQDVVAWIDEDGNQPRTVREAQFQAERLLTLRTRNSAAYKGLHALQMKRGARDFRSGKPIDLLAYFDDDIDIHHIFPSDWFTKQKVDASHADCIVNKTAIDAKTNRKIGGNAPSYYLGRLETDDKISTADLDLILRSHDIEPATMRSDDFPAFFNHRFERLIGQIEEAMGKPVNRASDQPDGALIPLPGPTS